MFIGDIYKNKDFVVSFEVFPPKKDNNISKLIDTVREIKKLNPDFVSVTYGAGGGTRDKTVKIASTIKNDINIEVMAHLTCVNSTKESITSILSELKKNNIKNILALRGDPPQDLNNTTAFNGDFKFASDLVSFIKNDDNWSIGVAGYPEVHRQAASLDEDVRMLKKKIDNGGDFVITQLFFDNSNYYRFIDEINKKNITVPIIPGIFPILNFKAIKRTTELSGATIPKELFDKLEQHKDSIEDTEKIGVEYAIKQSEDLLKNGVHGLHFYTMNKSKQITTIYNALKNQFIR